MRVLDRKLLRNLRSMRGQVIAIVLIIACGVASFVSVVTAYRALKDSRDSYYARYRLADVWAPVKRAPRSAALDLERIEGIRRVQGRILFEVTIDLPTLDLPASGRVISVPDRRDRSLNDLHLTSGRWFDGDGTREVILADRFARAHGIGPGDRLSVLMNNRKEALRVVATARSPEFIYLIRGAGDVLPDHENFTVLWLSESFSESVFDFEDACNEFVVTLERDASLEDVIDALDTRLDRYGAIGAYGRKDQLSNRYISDEIAGLRGTATAVPAVFLGVAAFVLHVLMGRLVQTQRTQVALLRAFGYSTGDLVAHFLKLSLLVALLGAALGTGLGLWFARWLVGAYKKFYSFPLLDFSPDPFALTIGLLVSVGFATLGTLGALRAVARLDPAEGMRPESPKVYRRTFFERVFAVLRLGFVGRMILRHMARTKVRAAMTVIGVAFACSILVLSFHGPDALDELMDVQFRLVERQDAKVAFHSEQGRGALYEMRRLDGVRVAEGELGVAARLVHGWRSKRTAILGLAQGQSLRSLINRDKRQVPLPREGLLLSSKLAQLLGVGPGDVIDIEVLTGRKPVFRAPVASVVEEYLGTFAYADITWLSRRIGEEFAMTGASLSIDGDARARLGRELKNLPAVAAVAFKQRTIDSFNETMAESQNIMYTTMILFAGVIVFGVLYNAARISMAERERELGSLRVLGFTNREVGGVLVGENLLLVVLGIVPGIGLGAFFSWALTRVYDTDLYRFPFVLTPTNVIYTVSTVVGFAIVANVAVALRLRRLDIVDVLKARE